MNERLMVEVTNPGDLIHWRPFPNMPPEKGSYLVIVKDIECMGGICQEVMFYHPENQKGSRWICRPYPNLSDDKVLWWMWLPNYPHMSEVETDTSDKVKELLEKAEKAEEEFDDRVCEFDRFMESMSGHLAEMRCELARMVKKC